MATIYPGPPLEIGIGRAVLYLQSRKVRFPKNSKGNIVIPEVLCKGISVTDEDAFPRSDHRRSSREAPRWRPIGVWTTVGLVVMVESCHGRGAICLSDRILQTHQVTVYGETSSLDEVVEEVARLHARRGGL